jgi:hypothetical protein
MTGTALLQPHAANISNGLPADIPGHASGMVPTPPVLVMSPTMAPPPLRGQNNHGLEGQHTEAGIALSEGMAPYGGNDLG